MLPLIIIPDVPGLKYFLRMETGEIGRVEDGKVVKELIKDNRDSSSDGTLFSLEKG